MSSKNESKKSNKKQIKKYVSDNSDNSDNSDYSDSSDSSDNLDYSDNLDDDVLIKKKSCDNKKQIKQYLSDDSEYDDSDYSEDKNSYCVCNSNCLCDSHIKKIHNSHLMKNSYDFYNCFHIEPLNKSNIVEPLKNEQIKNKCFAKIYSISYTKQCEMLQKVICILNKTKNINLNEIFELIDYIIELDTKIINSSKSTECSLFIQHKLFIELCIILCVDFKLTHEYIKLIVQHVCTSLAYIEKNKKKHDCYSKYDINKMIDKFGEFHNNLFSKKECDFLKKHAIFFQSHMIEKKSWNIKHIIEIIKNKIGFKLFFNNTEEMLRICKNNNITFNHSIFVEFLNEYIKMYQLYKKNQTNTINIENGIEKIIYVFINLNYKFDIHDFVVFFLLNNHFYYDHCYTNDYYSDDTSKSDNSGDQMNDVYSRIYFLVKQISDKKINLNINDFICELFFLNYEFVNNYITKTKCNDIVPSHIGLMCAICSTDTHHLKYYIEKKHVASQTDLIISLHIGHTISNYQMFEYLIKTGATITYDVYEYMCVIQINYKYEHICVLNESTKIEIQNKITSIETLINKKIANRDKKLSMIESKNVYHLTLQKKVSKKTLNDICTKCYLTEIVQYIKLNKISITPEIIDCLFLNQNLDVILYTIYKYNATISIHNIVAQKNPLMRYTLSKLYQESKK